MFGTFEKLAFPLGAQVGPPLVIIGPYPRPIRGVASHLCQRTERQSDDYGPADVGHQQSSYFITRPPQWQIRLWFHVGAQQIIGRQPLNLGRGVGCDPALFQHVSHCQWILWASPFQDACLPIFDQPDCPLGQVANIDDLRRPDRLADLPVAEIVVDYVGRD